MDVGVSVGPYVDRIESLPSSFAFAEYALGEGELPISEFDPAELGDSLEQAGLGGVVHLPYRQPLSTPVDRIDAATLEYLADVLGAAARSGADTAVAHPSARGAGHEFDRLTGQVSALNGRAEDNDITLCLETVGYAGGLGLDRVGALADRSGASVCLDVGYAYLEAGVEGIREFLESYGETVAHLHVHGARRRGDTHIPVGSGDVAYEAIGPVLAEAVSEATATIEVFTDDIEHLRDSARRVRAAVAGSE
jgi:sugar phosphate isomerase/epimerase